jgi:P22_AR N-terminal domain/ORF6C domain
MDVYEENNERLEQPEPEEDEAKGALTLVPLQVNQTDFHGDLLVVALVEIDGERQAVVPLRQFCDYLGIDWSAQRQRLVRDEVLAAEMLRIAVTNEQLPRKRGYYNRPVICLPLEVLPGWLFNISPTRVKPALQEKVQRYRRLCYRALWRAFQRGELFPVEEPTSVEASASTITGSHDLRVMALSEQIETLSAIVALMQEHKAALLAEGSAMEAVAANQQELMTRTAMMSSQLDYVVTLLEGLVGQEATTETRVARIDERTTHLTPQHAHYVREMVDRIVQEIDRRSPGRPLTYAQVYAHVYGRLKHHFRVAKYDQVSDERFEEVQTWLQEEWLRVRGGTLPEQEGLF